MSLQSEEFEDEGRINDRKRSKERSPVCKKMKMDMGEISFPLPRLIAYSFDTKETIRGFTKMRLLGKGDFAHVHEVVKWGKVYAAKHGLLGQNEVKHSLKCARYGVTKNVVDAWYAQKPTAKEEEYMIRAEDMIKYGKPLVYGAMVSEMLNTTLDVVYETSDCDDETWYITRKVMAKLLIMHQTARLVHNDIKGNNVMVDANGEPFFVDMGSSSPVYDTPGDDESADVEKIGYDWYRLYLMYVVGYQSIKKPPRVKKIMAILRKMATLIIIEALDKEVTIFEAENRIVNRVLTINIKGFETWLEEEGVDRVTGYGGDFDAYVAKV